MDTAVKVIVIGYQEKSFTDKCMCHFIYRFTEEFLNDMIDTSNLSHKYLNET